jgi:phosphopantetheinyl transferase
VYFFGGFVLILIAITLCGRENERDVAARLRASLLDLDGGGFGEKDIVRGEYGKPYIPCESAPRFSSSHSGGVACAASTVGNIKAINGTEHIAPQGEYELFEGRALYLKLCRGGGVGIDAEYIDPVMTKERMERLVDRYFTCGEREYIFAGGEDKEIRCRFYEIWTMKESYGKYTGAGISDGMKLDASEHRDGFVSAFCTGGDRTYLVTVYTPTSDGQ